MNFSKTFLVLGFSLVVLGGLFNNVVLYGDKMGVEYDSIPRIVVEEVELDSKHVLLPPGEKCILCDRYYYNGRVGSIGDFLIRGGLFLMITGMVIIGVQKIMIMIKNSSI